VFAGDGTDVDECKGGLGPCGSAEVAKTCTNSPGSYTCDCQDGYEFVNETCRGILHHYSKDPSTYGTSNCVDVLYVDGSLVYVNGP